MICEGKRILVTGGTGSLAQVLVHRLLSGEVGTPCKLIVFSRDEAKQHYLRMKYLNRATATDEVIYDNFRRLVEFRIGDVRDYASVADAVRDCDLIVNAAALKQVPTCEYFPGEAARTNIFGPANIVRAIREHKLSVETVVGVSTDKACKPVNVMGMTKAIQERVFISANVLCPSTRYICVRYGNVLASRGSVVPLFHDQIGKGGPVTITSHEMTRFLLSIDDAVDCIFAALREAKPGETYIPRIPSARVLDIARVLIGERPIAIKEIGVRPGEKIHEILISEEECHRTVDREHYYAIRPALPELRADDSEPLADLAREYSSASDILAIKPLRELLNKNGLLIGQKQPRESEELLRWAS